MKRTKRYLFVGIVALSMLLGGCATPMHELTEEEEALIVQYAAYAVAKHNIQQKDGMSGVYIGEEDMTDTEDETQTETETENDSEAGSTEDDKEQTDAISIAELIGHANDLTVTYAGSETAENYVEGGAYSVEAKTGKVFYVMKFQLTNHTVQPVEVDNASMHPIFKLVSGDISVKSEVTFLTTDFSTYKGTIAAGQTVETILLFEVSKDAAAKISEPTLSITIDNITKNVKL